MCRKARLRLLLSTLLILLFGTTMSAQINTDRMITVGRNALYFEDYVLSIQYFNQIINAKPFLYEPYFYRAVAKLSLEDYPGAEEDCDRSIQRNPFVVDSYQVRGLARINQGKYKEAIDDYRKGLSFEPENISLWHNYILCLIKENLIDDAISSIDTLLMTSPNYSPAMSMRSGILWNKNDTAGAIQWIDKAIMSDKYNPSLYQERGIFRAEMQQYDAAESDMDQSIYLDADNSTFYVNRALVRYYQNNLRGALADYELAIRTDANNILAYYNRGLLRAQVGDDNRAIEDFDIVINAEPDNYMAIFNRGLLRSATGDIRGAINDYSKVIEAYPDFVTGYSLRSEARYKIGDRAGGDADQLVVIQDQTRRFNNASGNNDNEANNSDNDKTRKQSDKNVRNYKKIVVADNADNVTGYSSEYRGKVQNRNFDVRFLPQYHLSYFIKINDIDRVQYSSTLDRLNNTSSFFSKIYISNSDISLTESQITGLFSDIDRQTAYISEYPNDAKYYFARALDFYLLQDFTSAENDLSSALNINSSYWAAVFCRAMVRIKMIELKKAEQSLDLHSGSSSSENTAHEPGYQSAINDLTKVIELEPQFAYAYYNRATIEALANDYHAALIDFDKAISLDEEFAEAYYNRGLVLVFLNRIDEAVKDLGKAGELGIYSAYNIIKRFSSSD
jgi:tetratricopeptide (TPR) repeat protein